MAAPTARLQVLQLQIRTTAIFHQGSDLRALPHPDNRLIQNLHHRQGRLQAPSAGPPSASRAGKSLGACCSINSPQPGRSPASRGRRFP
jgi:hypothetical protein